MPGDDVTVLVPGIMGSASGDRRGAVSDPDTPAGREQSLNHGPSRRPRIDHDFISDGTNP